MAGTYRRMSQVSAPAELMDGPTPRHSLLSGRFKQSFAYLSLCSRMPGILQQVITTLQYNMPELTEHYGQEVHKDIFSISEAIERLKQELNRDRQFLLFHGNEPDKTEWNAFLAELPGPKRTYFRACWLHAECYLYRRLNSFFENSKCLKDYDYFADLKHEDIQISVRAMEALTLATRNLKKNWENFNKLMHINLWSNHYEIQINASSYGSHEDFLDLDVLTHVANLDRRILVDDSSFIWNCLVNAKKSNVQPIIVDYICDNAGFEFFTDMLFIEYLIDAGLANIVRLHVKAIPWYISDVTKQDVSWTLEFLSTHSNETLASLGHKLTRMMREGSIIIAKQSYFWTGPQAYFVMVDVDLELYKLLTEAQVAIFKGDLNYRKLLGDYIWDSTEEFITCLRGFRPCNICAVRAVKCEVVCGLPEGVYDYLVRVDPQWMISGTYGVIQYTDSLKCGCGVGGQISVQSSERKKP